MNDKNNNHDNAIQIYGSAVTSLITICIGGLAASTALMQLFGVKNFNKYLYVISIVLFFLALIAGFLTFSGIIGQAVQDKPNINVWNIRYPALFTFFLMIIGFMVLVLGSICSPEKKVFDNKNIIMKLESCSSKIIANSNKRLICFDSLSESIISKLDITLDDIKQLSDKDKAWIKLLMIKNRK